MKIDIYRYYMDSKVTLSVLKIDGMDHKPLYVLENPWLDNKIGESCIPYGTYVCEPYTSARYPDVYRVTKVFGRSHILFHAGNYPKDTRGCLLLGMGVDYNKSPMVTSSRNALNLFRKLVGPNNFILTIKEL